MRGSIAVSLPGAVVARKGAHAQSWPEAHQQRAVAPGPAPGNAERGEALDHLAVGHAEAAVARGGHDRERWRHGAQEGAAGGGAAAVMAELEHVRAQRRRAERPLASRLEIARQQQRAAAGADAQHERGIVARSGARAAPGPERLDPEVAQPERRVLGGALRDRDAARACRGHERREGRVRAAAGRQPEAPRRHLAQHRDEAAGMIEVRVARDDEIEHMDAERAERRHHHALARVEAFRKGDAAVDQHAGLAPLHERRVALSNVEEERARGLGIERGRRAQRRRGRGEQREAEAQRGGPRAHTGDGEARGGDEAEHRGCDARPRRRDRREPRDRVERRLRELGRSAQALRQQPRVDVGPGDGRRARRQGERQEHEGGERDRDAVREPAERRDGAEVPRDERRGGGRGAGRDAERRHQRGECRTRGAGARALGPRRAPHQRGSGSEGELDAGREGRRRIDRGHGEKRRCEHHRRDQAPARELRQREQRQEHERALHGGREAGEQRVDGTRPDRHAHRAAPRVAARREPGAAPQQRRARKIDRAGNQPEVETRHRHQVREPDPREVAARARRERPALAEPERREQATTRPFACETLRAAPPQGRQRFERGARGRRCDLRAEQRVDLAGNRPDPAPAQRARGVAAARVRAPSHGTEAKRDPHPAPRAPGRRLRLRGVRADQDPRGHLGRGSGRARVGQHDLELRGTAAHRLDPCLDHRLRRLARRGRTRGCALEGGRRPSRGERADERRRKAQPGRDRDRADHERVRPEPQPAARRHRLAIAEQQAEPVCPGQRGEQPAHDAPRGTAGCAEAS
jgi:hypothetical protein